MWYSCDFETDTTQVDKTFVWAFGAMRIDKHMRENNTGSENNTERENNTQRDNNTLVTKTSIVDAIEWMFETAVNDGETPTFWFHNLKFDGFFIAFELLVHQGFIQVMEKNNMPDNSLYTLISESGEWYMMKVKCQGVTILIQNSLRKLPFRVKDIAKSLKLEHLKGEIDYKLFRPEGGELSKTDYDYLYNDVWIIKEALGRMFLDNNLTSLTIGSDCMKDFKERTTKFDEWFPIINLDDDGFIRKAYKGGYTYKADNAGHEKNGCTYDYNSMYPSVMHSQSGYIFPYDEPVYYKGEYIENIEYPLYVQRIKCKFKLKKGYVPTIQIKGGRFRETEYLVESNGEVDLTLSNVDLDLLYEHYHVYDDNHIEGYMFKGKTGMFDDYINYWFDMKQKGDREKNPVIRQLAKLFLNNLYGKFATNTNAPLKVFNELDSVNNGFTFKKIDNTVDGVYIPVGVFTTSYARLELITAIQKNFKYFCYCDTDSIHLKCPTDKVVGLNIHDINLGAWKCEGVWSEAIFVRQKTYMEFIKNEWDIKCAGCPDDLKQYITPENFKSGLTLPPDDGVIDESKYAYKLKPKKVYGGVILEPIHFTMS